MQIVSIGDNLHEISNYVFFFQKKKNKKNIINLSSAEFSKRCIYPKYSDYFTLSYE